MDKWNWKSEKLPNLFKDKNISIYSRIYLYSFNNRFLAAADNAKKEILHEISRLKFREFFEIRLMMGL